MISSLCLTTNGYKVIESENVLLPYWDSELNMKIEFESGFSFNILFKFISTDEKESSIYKDVDDKTIIFECRNCNSELGTGTKAPLSIATVNNKEIFIHFSVYMRGKQEGRKIEFTFLEKQ